MQKLNRRNPLIAVGVSGFMVAGILGAAGVAVAQQSPGDPAETPTTQTEPVPGEGHGDQTKGLRGHHGLLGLGAIVRASGLEPQVFREAFAEGDTPAVVLEANGIDVEATKSSVLAALQDRLQTAVDNGRLSQERADAALATATEKLNELMNTVPSLSLDRPLHFNGPAPFLDVAEFLGIDRPTLIQSLRDGMTLAEVAAANGSSAEALIEHLVAESNARIDQALTDGKIDEARAAELKSAAEERITAMVNETGSRLPRDVRPGHRGGPFGGTFRDRGFEAPLTEDDASAPPSSANGIA